MAAASETPDPTPPAPADALARAKARIERRFDGRPAAAHAYSFPASPRFVATSSTGLAADLRAGETAHGQVGYDPADGLFKYADGALIPRLNSDLLILRAVQAREAETIARAEAALSLADAFVAERAA
jgi:hypothetical protein